MDNAKWHNYKEERMKEMRKRGKWEEGGNSERVLYSHTHTWSWERPSLLCLRGSKVVSRCNWVGHQHGHFPSGLLWTKKQVCSQEREGGPGKSWACQCGVEPRLEPAHWSCSCWHNPAECRPRYQCRRILWTKHLEKRRSEQGIEGLRWSKITVKKATACLWQGQKGNKI